MKTIKELEEGTWKISEVKDNNYKQALKDVLKLMKEFDEKDIRARIKWNLLKARIEG